CPGDRRATGQRFKPAGGDLEMNNRRLAGKVAIVTGSGRGIGRREERTLAREGAKAVVSAVGTNSEGKSSAAVVVEEIRVAGGEAVASTEDLMKPGGAQRTIETAADTFGGLDILVTNGRLR